MVHAAKIQHVAFLAFFLLVTRLRPELLLLVVRIDVWFDLDASRVVEVS